MSASSARRSSMRAASSSEHGRICQPPGSWPWTLWSVGRRQDAERPHRTSTPATSPGVRSLQRRHGRYAPRAHHQRRLIAGGLTGATHAGMSLRPPHDQLDLQDLAQRRRRADPSGSMGRRLLARRMPPVCACGVTLPYHTPGGHPGRGLMRRAWRHPRSPARRKQPERSAGPRARRGLGRRGGPAAAPAGWRRRRRQRALCALEEGGALAPLLGMRRDAAPAGEAASRRIRGHPHHRPAASTEPR